MILFPFQRHYRVRNGPTVGTFRLSVLDNGVTSDEFWTILGAADDLSWIAFHYAGAAKTVGQVSTNLLGGKNIPFLDLAV